ncbi:tripartite tricarboxylate transporter substrate binding protein [Rhodoferax sp. BAB1]|uniref:Bug family tripartite tricarboxylate transporter substrate binding protein n=1 Tax=Rhodoferax sp. BAB1 TaxID=2741720 RepID=UPI0015758E76|nr:tripartite tricarboxylate transporter substrate binding protein [Rhodoferax sp. BAB1]QKO22197.1 tripartite tricarboxylate transporter substrate binding protein [Rhodoferax sp. BAB1]
MNLLNRRALVAVLAATLASAGWAQSFPSKPLKIIVPFGAGGVADLTARTVGQKLSQTLGQPVVIENKPGAGGVGAADTVAKSAPDGYTLLLMSNASAVTATLFNKLPYDTVKDFTPVSTLGFFDIAVVTATESKFKTLGEVLAYAKANPGKLNVGSINIGSTQNLAAELFKSNSGMDMQIVPFNGTPAVVNALRGGQIDVAVEIVSPIMGQIKGGALRALAITDTTRSALLPDVPTTKEAGLPNYQASSWNALAVPSGTPKDVVARLHREIAAAISDPEVSKKLRDLNIEPRASTPEQTQAFLQSEIKRWGDVIVKANIPRQ